MAESVEFDPAAREEFDEAFDWYSARSHAAAIGFAAAVDAAIDRISADPQRFPKTFSECQYCLLHRYPFCVVFYQSVRGIYIVAVAHAKRRPGYWRTRL